MKQSEQYTCIIAYLREDTKGAMVSFWALNPSCRIRLGNNQFTSTGFQAFIPKSFFIPMQDRYITRNW